MAYSFNRQITLLHGQVGGSDALNFPLLFSGTYPWLATIANGGHVTNNNGYDIIFAADSGGVTTYSFEIDSYNAATGAVNFWIKIPTLSHSVDTNVFILYGNPAITTFQGSINGTWDASFLSVVHFNAAGTQTDSTSNGNSLNSVSGTPAYSNSNSLFGYAFNGNGANSVFRTAVNIGTDGPLTVSCWYKFPTTPSNSADNCIVGVGAGGTTNFRAVFDYARTLASMNVDTGTIDPHFALVADTNWHHICFTIPTTALVTQLLLYLDGTSRTLTGATATAFNFSASSHLTVNGIPGSEGSADTNAYVDEFRVSTTQRSADWITAEFNNQSSPSTFYTVGAENAGGAYLQGANDRLLLSDGITVAGGPPNFKYSFSDNLANLQDSAALAENIIEKFSDSLTVLTDSISLLVGIPIQVFDSQFFNWADGFSKLLVGVINESPSDTLALSDAVSTIIRTTKLFLSIADNFNTLSDALGTVRALQALVLSDTLVLSDSFRAQLNWLAKVADFMSTLADSAGYAFNNLPKFSDTMSISDSVSLALSILLQIRPSDTLNLSDSFPLLSLTCAYDTSVLSRIRRYLGDLVSGNAQPS